MLPALPPEVAGLLALLALALLPGVLLVRAPWTTVPALSVAFWTLGWWWLPLGSRSRLLAGALVLFSALAVLRLLPKHVVPPPPGYDGPPPPPPVTGPTTGRVPPLVSAPSLVVGALALALLVPVPLWPHAPGREMAFHTTAARLAMWRDALPATYEPLLPLPQFGAHSPGLPTLAADVGLLSGLDPGRAVALAAQLSAGLLLIGLYGLLATRLRPSSAALGAVLGLAVAPWPSFLAAWGQGGPVLALALALSAATLLVGHASKPSAAAAGTLLGAALLAQPALATAVVVATGAVQHIRRRVSRREAPREDRSPAPPEGEVPRLALALGVALACAGPALLRLGRALSVSELTRTLAAIDGSELMSFATGLALLVLAALLAHHLGEAAPTSSKALTRVLVAVSGGIVLLSVHAAPAAGQLSPGALRALAGLDAEIRPLEAVCAPEGVLDWVPALGGRRAGTAGPDPWVPPPLREEMGRAPRQGCSRILDGAGSQPLTSRGGTPLPALRTTP